MIQSSQFHDDSIISRHNDTKHLEDPWTRASSIPVSGAMPPRQVSEDTLIQGSSKYYLLYKYRYNICSDRTLCYIIIQVPVQYLVQSDLLLHYYTCTSTIFGPIGPFVSLLYMYRYNIWSDRTFFCDAVRIKFRNCGSDFISRGTH